MAAAGANLEDDLVLVLTFLGSYHRHQANFWLLCFTSEPRSEVCFDNDGDSQEMPNLTI